MHSLPWIESSKFLVERRIKVGRTTWNMMVNVVPLIIITACSSASNTDSESAGLTIDTNLRTLINEHNLSGDPTANRLLPSIQSPKSQLGMKLFFSKSLGGDSDAACVSCHHPVLGGGDALSLPIGVGAESPDLLGPGRKHAQTSPEHDGGPTVPRNSPSTFNIALWDQALFLDGRVESLGKTLNVNGNDGEGIRTPDTLFGQSDPEAGENLTIAQARFPVTSPEEMRGFTFQSQGTNSDVRLALAARLTSHGGWAEEFTHAFGDPTINYDRIAEAIGEYERSQIFIETPWKAYVEGNSDALSQEAKFGALLFFNSNVNGGANCVSCHTGDFFTDEKYYVTATPQIGRGKGNDNDVSSNDDFGRFRETNDTNDKYKFRTATLLNVEVTGPWGHAGAYTTLESVTKHMINPDDAVQNYDFLQLDPNIQAEDMQINTQFALEQLQSNRMNNVENVLANVIFSDEQVSNLIEFLKALTDPCVKNRHCLADWIPDAMDSNPDGSRLNAINSSSEYL